MRSTPKADSSAKVHWWDDDAEIEANVLTGEAWVVNSDSAAAYTNADDGNPRLDWVICGGESGPGARPMHPQWARSLRDQCAAAGVSYLFKQWGEWAPIDTLPPGQDAGSGGFAEAHGHLFHRRGKKAAGRLLDGVEHSEFPT